MRRALIGCFVFLGATALAATLYALTLPDGLPWGVRTGLVGQYALPLCAVAAGMLGVSVCRFLGWKIGCAAALVWMFLPRVWNAAILGDARVAYAALGVIGLWLLDTVLRVVLRKAIAVHQAAHEQGQGMLTDGLVGGWRGRVNFLASWIFLGAAAIFAVASLLLHDGRLGEPASAFARGVVEAAGDRIIVLDGVCDAQVERELESRRAGRAGTDAHSTIRALSLVRGEVYRQTVQSWVEAEWPGETNLALAAQIGVAAFAKEAVRAHPARFYRMSGEDTTRAAFERRWAAFGPYLASSDRFVPVARRHFAREANAVANALQETDPAAAWKLYARISGEIDWGNVSAFINRSEMLRRGYVAPPRDAQEVRKAVTAFFSQRQNRHRFGEIVRLAGPVKADPELLAQMAAAAKRQVQAAQKDAKPTPLSPEVLSLLDANDAMVKAVDAGDFGTAGRLARKILSQPQWADWSPANAVMGDVAAAKGDYASAEAFYRKATSSLGETPSVVWNNYADTLMNLGKFDEAEAILRREVARTDETSYLLRITLAEVLTRKAEKRAAEEAVVGALREEVRTLVMSVVKNAPADVVRLLRAKQKSGELLK